jgi:hypothetical protein
MYTYNKIYFGVELPKQLLTFLEEEIIELIDSEFIESHYHGGSEYSPISVGIEVKVKPTAENIRLLKEEDYIEQYNKAKEEFLDTDYELNILADELDMNDEERQKLLTNFESLKAFIKDTKPDFYLLEVSS